jgi:hypothetical protein
MTRWLLIFMAVLGIGATAPVLSDAANRKVMYEGWLHSGNPDLSVTMGIKNLQYVSSNNPIALSGLWTDLTNLPPAPWYDMLASFYTHPDNILLLDIESWPSSTQAERLATATKFVTVYNEMKARRPDLRIGFYAFPQTGIHKFVWTTGQTADVSPGGASFMAWQAENDDFAAMWAVVDYVFPSLYYPYDRVNAPAAPISQPYIHNYFYYNLLDMIRCRTAYSTKNPPIISYVWHQNATYAHDLDQDVWEDMIQTAYLMGDGMILWSINTGPAWNDNDWWWKQFLAKWPFGDKTLIKPRNVRAF